MKRIIVLAIAGAFLTTPAFADTFKADQEAMLKKITAKMEKFKASPAKIDFLTKKKACVEKAKDAKGLADCKAKMPPEQLDKIK